MASCQLPVAQDIHVADRHRPPFYALLAVLTARYQPLTALLAFVAGRTTAPIIFLHSWPGLNSKPLDLLAVDGGC